MNGIIVKRKSKSKKSKFEFKKVQIIAKFLQLVLQREKMNKNIKDLVDSSLVK